MSAEQVRTLRRLLNRLAESRCEDGDTQELVGDEVCTEVRGLPRENLLESLDEAVGNNKKRKAEAVYILCELTDIPEAVDRIGDWLADPDPQTRSWLIQTIAGRKLGQFAPLLNRLILHDPDDFCRDMAIHTAGRLRNEVNISALVKVAESNQPKLTWRLAETFSKYAAEEFRPYLQQWFLDTSQPKSTRIFAAWGLGKMGDDPAKQYLYEMLFDPEVRTPKSYDPGESRRAAQAICDIRGWEFDGSRDSIAKTIKKLQEIGVL